MFTIMEVKLFDGQEYKIEGNSKEAELLWRPSPSEKWELLWFKDIEDNGIELCVEQLCDELTDLVHERRAKQRMDDFIVQAIKNCGKQIPESKW